MLKNVNTTSVLFLDIETVPLHSDYNLLSDHQKKLWDKKAKTLAANEYERAGIYAEFGKIICISTCRINVAGSRKRIISKSFYGHSEKKLLSEFSDYLSENPTIRFLCAHNGKEFDFPFLCRRMVINRIELPSLLSLAGKKPWEIPHFDTMELWKFGDHKCYTSLDVLASCLGLDNPKEKMDGSEVFNAYYRENNLDGIVDYCEEDVRTVMNIFLSLKGEKIIKNNLQPC